MARKKKTHIPGTLNYVVLSARFAWATADGKDAQASAATSFLDDFERREFLRRLPASLRACGATLHGLCLADDVRLLLEVSDKPLGKCIQHIRSYFARWANGHHARTAPLFSKGYCAVPIADRLLMIDALRHLHRTPLAARLTRDLDRYPWSSHPAYCGLDNLPWLTTHRILRLFNPDPVIARQLYHRYILRKTAPKPLFNTSATPPEEFCHGDRKFLRWLFEQQREESRPATLEQVIEATCERMEVNPADLISPSRERYLSLSRAVVFWHATRSNVATQRELGVRLHRDPSSLYDACRRYQPLYPELFAIELRVFLQSACERFGEKRVRRARPRTEPPAQSGAPARRLGGQVVQPVPPSHAESASDDQHLRWCKQFRLSLTGKPPPETPA